MTQIDRLERRRSWTLIIMALAFILFQSGELLKSLPTLMAEPPLWLVPVTLLGALSWLAACLMFLVYAGQVTRHKACYALDDELDRHYRAKAVKLGFGLAIVTLTLLAHGPNILEIMALAMGVSAPAWLANTQALIHIGLILCIVVPTFYYVALTYPQAEPQA
ncbi:hypothetical protein [Woodsholea maritima]|uniref:hypothetical protein n=1 Tax=Woodsholea maritima TaxID=240237 RepID=UPI00037383A5|nr:hypothetical protein [Woodsholea maritima]